jgi:hypothetical protein
MTYSTDSNNSQFPMGYQWRDKLGSWLPKLHPIASKESEIIMDIQETLVRLEEKLETQTVLINTIVAFITKDNIK